MEINLKNEIGTKSDPASIEIRSDKNELIAQYSAYIDAEPGADGGLYRVVKFRKVIDDTSNYEAKSKKETVSESDSSCGRCGNSWCAGGMQCYVYAGHP